MRQYDANNLIVHPGGGHSSQTVDPDVIVEVTPEMAGWDTITFQARRLAAGNSWAFSSRQNELALVVLAGTVNIESSHGTWMEVGKRLSVFDGLPYALYLSVDTRFTVSAVTDCQFAVAQAATEQSFPPRLMTPADVMVEIRGGDHATRQINSIIPPGFPCARLVVVEVYTPGGNWSSYPPHKHDVIKNRPDGSILEADLDEVYYYKIDRPEGYALQRVYTDPESPLHQAGYPVDSLLMPRNDDVVLVPEGYHPVSSPPGYTTYYLNVLVGNTQSLSATDDPQYTWVKSTYQTRDPRVPIYDVSAAKGVRAG